MAHPSMTIDIYLALNRELRQQNDWFSLQLQRHTRFRSELVEIKKWEASVPANILQDIADEASRLQASLEWYRSKPWYQRWWLRQSSNVSWVARYYVYKRGSDALGHWGEMSDSYQALQRIRRESQRYLAAFSWDRIKLKQTFKKLDRYWQQTVFANRLKTINKQRPAVVRSELINILKKTNKELRSLASTKLGGFFSLSPTYYELAVEHKFLNSSQQEAKRKELAASACESGQHGWLGRLHPSKKIHEERQVLYFVLLSRVTSKLLAEFKNKHLSSDFDATWAELERLVTEGVFLSNGYSQLTNKPAKIWSVYNELFIELSQLAFNPRTSEPARIEHWQMMVHKTGGWFHALLQFLSGRPSQPTASDQRLQIESYIDLVSMYHQVVVNKKQYLMQHHTHTQAATLKKLQQEMEGNLNQVYGLLAELQKQTSLADIQQLGNECQQLLARFRQQLQQFHHIASQDDAEMPAPAQAAGFNLKTEVPSIPSSPRAEKSKSSFASPSTGSPSSAQSSPTSSPRLMPNAAAAAAPIEENKEEEYLNIPDDRTNREKVIDACRVLRVMVSSSQEVVSWQAIRKAYKKRALETHPDKQGGNTELFKKVNDAHQYLHELHLKQLEQEEAMQPHGVRASMPATSNDKKQAKARFYREQYARDWRKRCAEVEKAFEEYNRSVQQTKQSMQELAVEIEITKQQQAAFKQEEALKWQELKAKSAKQNKEIQTLEEQIMMIFKMHGQEAPVAATGMPSPITSDAPLESQDPPLIALSFATPLSINSARFQYAAGGSCAQQSVAHMPSAEDTVITKAAP